MKLLKLAGALAVSALALTSQVQAEGKGLIGISMPTKSSARWIDDGNNMVKQFQAAGYDTDLQYAEDDIPNQLAQIENMVTKGAKVLIVGAIDELPPFHSGLLLGNGAPLLRVGQCGA